MARPPDVATPQSRMAAAQAIEGTLRYPLDVESYKYNTIMSFIEYERPAATGRTRYTTKSTLVLPLPMNLAQSYGIGISTDKQLGILGNISTSKDRAQDKNVNEIVQDAGDYLSRMTNNVMTPGSLESGLNTVKNLTNRAFEEIGKTDALSALLVTSKLFGQDIQTMTQATVGRIVNPHVAALFDGVSLRAFQYRWRVSPRSLDESIMLERIFNHIKRNMHPTIPNAGGTRAFLAYPNQVLIEFQNLGNYTKVGRSFITDFVVDSTPSGHPSLFKDGSPTEIEFSISVVETEIKTSEDF
jgi:hypothetical protein